MSKLKEKLITLLREEISEHGPVFGWLALAEAEGSYLVREDGAVVGIGTYQKLQSHHGVQTLHDLDV